MNLRNLSGKSRKIKDASSRGIKLPTSNLYFYGTKYDINGNKCAVFSFGANSRKWSVQTSSYGISKGISYMPSNTKPEDILVDDEVASKLEQNVINYINEFGSSKLKDQLYIYDSVMDSRRVSDGAQYDDVESQEEYDYCKQTAEEIDNWLEYENGVPYNDVCAELESRGFVLSKRHGRGDVEQIWQVKNNLTNAGLYLRVVKNKTIAKHCDFAFNIYLFNEDEWKMYSL